MRTLTKKEEERCQIAIAKSVHQIILSKRKNEWLILGDETGGLAEFKGGKPHRPGRMMWIAVPPSVNLPELHPFYHGQDAEWFEHETIYALQNLQHEKEVGCFIFTHKEGFSPGEFIEEIKNDSKTKKLVSPFDSKLAQKEHLLLWQFTLPLVLEWVASRVTKNQKVSIYIERVDPLVPGEMPLASIMQEFVSGLQQRDSWSRLKFSHHSILAKEPLEHPWLGYTDALGHIFNEEIPESAAELFEQMKQRVISVPYRQSSLNGIIRQLLKDTARPLYFLQTLHSNDANDFQDYISPFFQNAIAESLSSLSEEEDWQELLKHIERNSEDKKGQRATALIHNYINVNEVLSILTSSSDKFDLLRMMLGTCNHRGEIQQGLDCKEKADLLLKSFEPSERKLQKYHNICRGLKDNMFDFEEIDRVGDFEYKSNMEEGKLRQLGTRAHSLGLIGTVKTRQIALLIERKLARHGNEDADYSSHRRRHSIYLSELLMDEEKYIEAEEILDDISHKDRDSFFFASHIKCLTLSEKNNVFFKTKDLDFLKLLDDDHPSQRIAYWFARWAIQVGKENEAPAQECIERLLSLTEVPLFSHDAPGVILSCELMDLKSRGYKINIDTMKFYELVKKNSQPSTIKWLKKHPPSEDDWLAPLNFNYR